ncbi:MAG: YitT family protein [Clostridia bacterium]|nr:YitT family protein [Clostridia bacterium]MBQ4543730.1 YitT family protein [Clostridia bacterium]MBQ7075397.1 YitT family protein [Clostridia bacterium]
MKNNGKFIIKYFYITLGTLIAALGLNLFLIPNQLAVGGVSGLSTAVNHLINIPVGTLSVILNVPLFILGMIFEGKSFAVKSLFATFTLAVFLDVFSFVPNLAPDLVTASVFGGALSGFGFGLVLLKGASTGGSDIIAKIINRRRGHLSIGNILFVTDILIILFATVVFKSINTGLYSIFALYVCSKTIDLLTEGVKFAKLAFIISDNHINIAKEINRKINRGATFLTGKGAYSYKSKYVIMCSLKKNEITMLKELIYKIDPKAFMIITDAREVLGEGFIKI